MQYRYRNYDDLARLEYGRMFWRNPRLREKLISHWVDARHPYAESFKENKEIISTLLESQEQEEASLDRQFREKGLSLRIVIRMIPPVFGHFWS